MSKEKKNYQSKYPSYLPKQSDKKYFDIENFIDYWNDPENIDTN